MKETDDVAKRRIDYTQEEIAQQLHMSKSTIGNRMREIVDYYNLEEDAFNKEVGGNPRKFLPPEYTPLLKIIMQEYKNNPATKQAGKEKIDADMVIAFNSAMQKAISESEDLPIEYKVLLQEQPWHDVSKTIVDYLPILIDELSEFIYNLLNSKDLGETIKFLCRELDKMNYCLCRGNYTQSETSKVASIDNGIMHIIKNMMEDMGIAQLQDQMSERPPEFLTFDEREKLERQIKESKPEISDQVLKTEANSEERKKYLESKIKYILYSIRKSNDLKWVRYTIQTGKKWKPIREQIREGRFRESVVFAKDVQKAKLEEQPIWIPPQEIEDQIQKNFLDLEREVKKNTINLHQIVKRMVGQVIVDYFARNK